jgi:CRISPR-associated exonuclease Cas4
VYTGFDRLNQHSVPVSLLAAASRCPVRAYFMNSSQWEEPHAYTVCKQVSYHLGEALCFDEIWDEIINISPSMGEADEALLDLCIKQCLGRTWRIASDLDVRVRSEKYGIHGVIDRIFGELPYFSIVRPVKPPAAGIFAQDRVRVTAYALCLTEMYGNEIRAGNVEYLPGGESRSCEIQPGDMRKFYSGLRMARNIDAGSVPKKPVHAPCSSCPYYSRCDPGPKSLSDRLHQK